MIGGLPGNTVDLSGAGTFRGTILAPHRAIHADTLLVIGALIGGMDGSFDELVEDGASMSVHSSATITRTRFVETPAGECIEITKSVSPLKQAVGQPVTYTFVVENCGPADLTITSIVDTLLGNLQAAFVADHGGSLLGAGQSETFDVASVVPGDKGNPVTNVVTVTAAAGSATAIDSDTATLTIPVTISGGAYDDKDCNGQLDPEDTPLPGATFALTDLNGYPVSDLDGNPVVAQLGSAFSFTNLAPGAYIVTEIDPGGYQSTEAIPGTGGTMLSDSAIRVDTLGGFDYPGHAFLDGQCEMPLYQAYPGNSSGLNSAFAGYAGPAGDNTTSVPGVLQIIPQDAGEPDWANFICGYAGGAYSSTVQLQSVILTKQTPLLAACGPLFPQTTVIQNGTDDIRLWWPLMYEVPDTSWTLEITWTSATPPLVRVETWVWRVDATLQSLKDTLQLFREAPYGIAEVPLVSDEVLYPLLQAKLDGVMQAINNSDLHAAGDILADFMAEVSNAILAMAPIYPYPTGPHTGITQTVENPTACKLLTDAMFIGDKYGLFH